MLKLGIRRLTEFPFASSASGLKFRSTSRVSYQLLRTSSQPSKHEIEIFDHITRQMQLSSGVFRTTTRGRFADLDPQIGRILAERFAASSPLHLHDLAASSCLTSAEWAADLFKEFPAAILTASDLTLYLIEATLPSGDVFLFEKDGGPLQYIKGPLVVRLMPPEPRLLLINSYFGMRAYGYFARAAWRLPEAWLRHDLLTTPDLSQDGVVFRKISLVHPEAGALLRRDTRFRIIQHSAFETLSTPVDVIRSLNIFNNSYFPPARLVEGVRAVWQSLRDGGIWIVGRTNGQSPDVHEVSVFARTFSGFSLLSRFGPGSEIEALVLEAVVF